MQIFDAHGDLFAYFYQHKDSLNTFDSYHLPKFQKGCVSSGVFNVWMPSRESTLDDFFDYVSYGLREIKSSDYLTMVRHFRDIDFNKNQIYCLMGLEGMDYVRRSEDVYALYEIGVRLGSLTWNYSNKLAASITDKNDFGLTKEGEKTIDLMKYLGILIDISHLSDQAAYSILDRSDGVPIIASHSNARSLCDHKRNLTDELLDKVAATGGVVGVNSYPPFIAKDESNQTLSFFIDHIDYIVKQIGIDHVGFGFDFMDYLKGYNLSSSLKGKLYLDDFKNQSDGQTIINALYDRGYSQEAVEKIAHKNFMRVIEVVL